MRNLLLILVAVVGVNAMVKATPPADSSIEQLADAPTFVAPEPVAEPKAKSPYAIAWESAQTSGKLAVFIKMERCEPCEKALPLFTEFAASGGYAAVVLDIEQDRELVAEIGKASIAPQIIVYEKRDGEWFKRSVIGNKPSEIKSAMAGANAVGEGLILSTSPTARPCSCESCPRDCAANGCKCADSSTVEQQSPVEQRSTIQRLRGCGSQCNSEAALFCGKQPSAGSGCASCGVSQGLPRRSFFRGRR